MKAKSFKVWIKDPYKLLLFDHLKRNARHCRHFLTIHELVRVETTDSISELKLILKRVSKRI